MLTKKITDGIYYVGANDRTTTRFEGLWPLPYGVSYNSYLVLATTKPQSSTVWKYPTLRADCPNQRHS